MKKKIAAPKLPKAPAMGREAAAMRLRAIYGQHVQRHRAHNGRLMLVNSVAEKTARNNYDIQSNALLGASNHGALSGYAIDQFGAPNTYLGK